MPTRQRTWTISQNNTPSDVSTVAAQGKEILLTFKNALKTAGWTVMQSSNSSTADTNDNWSSVSDVVNGTSAHSWIVLRSPANYPSSGNYIYFGIDYNSSDPAQLDWCTATANWSGLTTSVGPASSSSTDPNGSNVHTTTDDTYFIPKEVSDGSVRAVKYHICTNTTGDFIFYTSINATGQVFFGSFINKLSQAESVDDFPIATYFRGMGSSNSTSTSSFLYASNPFVLGDLSNGGGSGRGFKFDDGTVAMSSGITAHNYYYHEYWTVGHTTGFSTNMGSSTGDNISGKMPALPIWCTGAGGTNGKFIRGVLTDMYVANGSSQSLAATGDVTPGTGTITFGCVGSLWLPCDAAPNFQVTK